MRYILYIDSSDLNIPDKIIIPKFFMKLYTVYNISRTSKRIKKHHDEFQIKLKISR